MEDLKLEVTFVTTASADDVLEMLSGGLGVSLEFLVIQPKNLNAPIKKVKE